MRKLQYSCLYIIFLIESDEELFAENAEEYIRRDIEGSDVDTRRRAACDLVRVLSANFEAKIFEIFGQYLQVNQLIFCCIIIIIIIFILIIYF